MSEKKPAPDYEAEFDAILAKALREVVIEEQAALDAEIEALQKQGKLPISPPPIDFNKFFEKIEKNS